jgi:hypothetical protein
LDNLKIAKKGKLCEALGARNGYIKSIELESDDQRNIISTQNIKIERLETVYDWSDLTIQHTPSPHRMTFSS